MKAPPVRRASDGRGWALAALAYAALIVYGSLYPFSGWTIRGVKLFAFLSPELAGHLSRADLVTNVLAYMPLGLMLARWWRHRGSLLGAIAIPTPSAPPPPLFPPPRAWGGARGRGARPRAPGGAPPPPRRGPALCSFSRWS